MSKITTVANGTLTPAAEAELLVTDGGVRAFALYGPDPTPWHPATWASVGGIAVNPALGQLAAMVR